MCVASLALGARSSSRPGLDLIDAPARTVELVAEQRMGRTGRVAEAAMHALAQDFVGLGDLRSCELPR